MLGKNKIVSILANTGPYEIHINCFQMFYLSHSFSVSVHWNYIFFPFYANFTIIEFVQQLLGQAV